jgi:hypothetical protein
VSFLFRLVAVREVHRWKITGILQQALKHTHREIRKLPDCRAQFPVCRVM